MIKGSFIFTLALFMVSAILFIATQSYPWKAKYFLGSKDYLNSRFSGKFAASYDSVMLFWVTDIRDINNVHYDDNLIGRLKIDKGKFPPLRSSIDILGTITPEFAKETG
jgi:xylulokinase